MDTEETLGARQPKLGQVTNISRREFLKVVVPLTAGGIVTLKHWINENGPASFLSSFLTRNLKEDTPTEFRNEKEDPNPFFENPDRLLARGFKFYRQLSSEDPSQYPPLTFSKRQNYISAEDVLKRYKKFTPKEIVKDIASRQFSIASQTLAPGGGMFEIDQSTGGAILAFSGRSVENIHELIKIDPGSGFISRAIFKKFRINRQKFYSNHSLEKGFSENEAREIQESVTSELKDAVDYFKAIRAKSDTPLDLSDALVYFYKLNKGDIYTGLWDSVMFFKLLARNDLDTLNFNPTLEKSMLLAKLFKDPFSSRDSLNWLAHKYQEKGITKTHPLSQSTFDRSSTTTQNYMMVNRSGGIYHGLNILTWAAVCMDPLLVEMVTTAYSSWKLGNLTALDEHGEIKIEANLTVALKSPKIKQVVDRYVKTV